MSRSLVISSRILKLLLPLGLLLATLGVAAPAAQNAVPEDADDLTGRYRVLLIRAPAGSSVVDALETQAAASAERDLLWVAFHEERLTSNYQGILSATLASALRARLAASGARVLLLGKDGGSKLVADELDLERVFARIDSMPMRQQEMRERTARQ